jgi:UDP-N-acetylmuramyl tripeptide synthase
VLTVSDRAEAIRLAFQLAGPGDAVLVAGKGHETYQEINNKRLPFDDALHIREAIDSLTSKNP